MSADYGTARAIAENATKRARTIDIKDGK